MTYEKAVQFIESSKPQGSKLGLERMLKLCAHLGNPQEKLRVVHVAGTNGKGSTCQMIAAMLKQGGYHVGVYLSPYLTDVRDNMVVNGRKISQVDFARICGKLKKAADALAQENELVTEYELLTALAFLYFESKKCDMVILETGLGGRLDATNVVLKPLVSVLCAIDYDHMAVLGNTLKEIATEKCGIMKKDGVTVCYGAQPAEAQNVIVQRAAQRHNELIFPDMAKFSVQKSTLQGTRFLYGDNAYFIRLAGAHQVQNALVALETVSVLQKSYGIYISDKDVRIGIAKAKNPARMEILNQKPLVILDGAHNEQGMEALVSFVKLHVKQHPLIVVFGMLMDKPYEKAIAMLAPICDVLIGVTPDNLRALPATVTVELAIKAGVKAHAAENIKQAATMALGEVQYHGAVVICGSLYLAKDVKKCVKEILTPQA